MLPGGSRTLRRHVLELDMSVADPAQPLTTAVEELDDLSVDRSDRHIIICQSE